jgi:hypothetical protein
MSHDQISDDLMPRRAEALLSLRKGEGLTLAKLITVTDRRNLFGSDDPYESRKTIVDTIASEDEFALLALANALSLGEGLQNSMLMNRREAFVREHSVSMRTVTTREIEGAQVAAYLLPRFIGRLATEA